MTCDSYLESYLLINCDQTKEYVAEIIRNIKKVEKVDPTVGAFDIVTKLRTKNFEELKQIVRGEFDKVIDCSSALILTKKQDGFGISKLDDEFESSYVCCDVCGISFIHCNCKCPYCGQRDGCKCACGDAATGG